MTSPHAAGCKADPVPVGVLEQLTVGGSLTWARL